MPLTFEILKSGVNVPLVEFSARQNAAAWLDVDVSCLLLGIRHPGSGLERVPSAGGLLADLLLAEAGGGGVARGQSLCRSCHQTLSVLFSLQGEIFVLGLPGLHFDLLPVRLVLQQLLHNTNADYSDIYSRLLQDSKSS